MKLWQLRDKSTNETWVFTRNPSSMTSPFPTRPLDPMLPPVVDATSPTVWGQAPAPIEWGFTGKFRDKEQYDRLLEWSQRPAIIEVTDHLGRTFDVAFTHFDATEKRNRHLEWFGEYTMKGMLLSCDLVI